MLCVRTCVRALPLFAWILTGCLAFLYVAHQMVSVFDEPIAARFIDQKTGLITAGDLRSDFIEYATRGPTQVEFDFKQCSSDNLVRLFVGTHGTDSTQRLPMQWRILVKGEQGNWAASGKELHTTNYLNGRWYSFPVHTSSCFKSLAFDVNTIPASHILRFYRIQTYTLPWPQTIAPILDRISSPLETLFRKVTDFLHPLPFPPAMLIALIGLLAFDAGGKGWHGSMLYRLLVKRSASTNRDIVSMLISVAGIVSVLTTFYSMGASYATHALQSFITGWIKPYSFSIDTGFVVLDLFLYLLLVTFFDYWLHRLIHTRRFWSLHRFHHSATEFNGITVFRNHPALFAFEPIIKLWPLAIIPISPQVTPYWPIAGFFFWLQQVVTHADLNWTFGLLGRWLIVSPASHKVHHSNNPDHYDRNYGNLFIVWDRLFGTYITVPPAEISLGTQPAEEYLNKRSIIVEWGLDMANLVRANLGRHHVASVTKKIEVSDA